jgi:tetratricopeptide (TPR) repeat protein
MTASTSDLEQCYQLLGIGRGASIDELKTAYRTLARKLHPDLNPGDPNANRRFIAITEAYRVLLDRISLPSEAPIPTAPSVTVTVTRTSAPLTPQEAEVKSRTHTLIQSLLKQQEFFKAIGSIEALAEWLPHDSEVCQWQGMIYARCGTHLISRREFNKARIYLKKALKVDPHNRQLWQEVNRAFDRIERSM